MSEAYIGEIRMFGGNFAPVNWAFCDGRLLSISQYDALFDLIGTTYGGDGVTTFALPDLRGRIPLHMGQGNGLSPRAIGEMGGAEQVTLTTQQIPKHSHPAACVNVAGNQSTPIGNLWAAASTLTPYSNDVSSLQPMGPNAIGQAGRSLPHENRMPYLPIAFIIALVGIYPSRS